MKAKKSLGQNFLKSERALTKIIEAGGLQAGDTILEIGPGLGALTEKLLAHDIKLFAVEKDDQLYELLKEKFSAEISEGKLTLVHEDILDFKIPFTKYKLIANIPYNITGAILKRFLSEEKSPNKMVLLIQKEVAERIVARDGKESILSISVKACGQPKYVEKVLAGSFVPAPSVDSAILAIENISRDHFRGEIVEKAFFELLKTGFSSKRKKLASNLRVKYDKEIVSEAFSSLNLDENVRAEDINLETWMELAKVLCV